MQVNWCAVIVAAGSSFLLGGLWYAKPVFGRLWGREAGMLPADGEMPKGPKHPTRVFIASFIFSLIAAWAFAFLLGPNPPLGDALRMGFLAGACFVATSFGINYQFANRSALMWLIDGGYHLVQFLLFGLVLGLWH
ncbi:MAG: DUF1761 domain-containing protein [Acidobacteriota bacterium]